jgi:hypothetical protein
LFLRPYFEKTYHKKRTGRVTQDVGPEFKLQYCKKKKKNIKDEWYNCKEAQKSFFAAIK